MSIYNSPYSLRTASAETGWENSLFLLVVSRFHLVYLYIRKKKLLKVKSKVEVLAFGAYMFESLQSFSNSQVKAHSMCSMSNLQLICQNCRTAAISICY